jgi:hypothetical protein
MQISARNTLSVWGDESNKDDISIEMQMIVTRLNKRSDFPGLSGRITASLSNYFDFE